MRTLSLRLSLRARASLACAVALSLVAPAVAGAQPVASAATTAASAADDCPAVVVVAARGSDQNPEEGEYLGGQRYADSAPWESNGWEGRNWISFFHFVQAHSQASGQSVMDDVFVLGLDESAYPATMQLPPLAEEGEELDAFQMSSRVGEIVRTHRIDKLVRSVTIGALDSIQEGRANAPGVVADYEARTGCAPQYVIAGYSQGAIVGTSLERHLAATGRLAGVMYLGNPLLRPNSGGTVLGNPVRGGGLAEVAPRHFRPQPAALPKEKRVNYCLRGDFSCDLTGQSALEALSDKAERHASYFLDAAAGNPTRSDVRAAEAFIGWVTAAQEKPQVRAQ